MVRNAATALDANHPDTVTLCSMAKMFATENCSEVQSQSQYTTPEYRKRLNAGIVLVYY